MKKLLITIASLVSILSFSQKTTKFTQVMLGPQPSITSGIMWNFKTKTDYITVDLGVAGKIGAGYDLTLLLGDEFILPISVIRLLPVFKWEIVVESKNPRVQGYFGTDFGVGLQLYPTFTKKADNSDEIEFNAIKPWFATSSNIHGGIRIDEKGTFGLFLSPTGLIGIEFGGVY